MTDSKQRRTKIRDEVQARHKVKVRMGNEHFLLTDYTDKGMACEREAPTASAIPFEVGSTQDADFVVHGIRRAQARIKIIWVEEGAMGAKVVDAIAFQAFAREYLSAIKRR